MGYSPRMTSTPNIRRIINHGLYTFNGRTEFPPVSGPCWGTILHGVSPSIHKITNGSAKANVYPTDSPYPSIFRIVHEKKPDLKLASFCKWPQINHGIIEQNQDVHFYTGADCFVTRSLKTYIKRNDVNLLFTVLDNVDHAGHKNGYYTDKYYEQVRKTDQQVGQILDEIEKKGWFDDSLIMIITDHGGGGGSPNGHGSNTPKDMTVCFGLRGPQIPHEEIKNFRNCDIPSIVLSAFNIEKPSNWEGRTLQEILQH